MQGQNHHSHLKILWEDTHDPTAEELLRQVIALVLSAPEELSPEAPFDSRELTGLNEDVPVENENQQTTNQ
jgi:hypothetical protein